MPVPKKRKSYSKIGQHRSHSYLRKDTSYTVYPDCCDRPLPPHRTCEKGFECDAYAKNKKGKK